MAIDPYMFSPELRRKFLEELESATELGFCARMIPNSSGDHLLIIDSNRPLGNIVVDKYHVSQVLTRDELNQLYMEERGGAESTFYQLRPKTKHRLAEWFGKPVQDYRNAGDMCVFSSVGERVNPYQSN